MPIRPDLPPEPEFGAPLDPAHPSPDTLRLLALRRSTPVAALGFTDCRGLVCEAWLPDVD